MRLDVEYYLDVWLCVFSAIEWELSTSKGYAVSSASEVRSFSFDESEYVEWMEEFKTDLAEVSWTIYDTDEHYKNYISKLMWLNKKYKCFF